MRFRHFLLACTSVTLALAPAACSSSSGSDCTYPPGPAAVATLVAPCGLTITSVAVTGPCSQFGTASMPEVQGTGGGTCDVRATLSNGVAATGSVDFASTAYCYYYTSSPAGPVTLTISGSTGCGAGDAGAASDAAAH